MDHQYYKDAICINVICTNKDSRYIIVNMCAM